MATRGDDAEETSTSGPDEAPSDPSLVPTDQFEIWSWYFYDWCAPRPSLPSAGGRLGTSRPRRMSIAL
jgi:hypothetical protein